MSAPLSADVRNRFQARRHWLHWTLPAIAQAPNRVVFIPSRASCQAKDETSVKTNMARLRGRSKCGTRLNSSALFGAWGIQAFIAGLTHDQLIALWVIKGAMDGAAFAAYVREGLVPEIEPGTVVICDNLAMHKNAEAAAALRAHECWFLYLRPYSPDLNPIEQAFAKLKAHLRKLGARTFSDLFEAIGDICDLFTPGERWDFLANAGYAST